MNRRAFQPVNCLSMHFEGIEKEMKGRLQPPPFNLYRGYGG